MREKIKLRGVTDLEERFARLVVQLGNATEAYRRASKTNMRSRQGLATQAKRLMRRPPVRSRVEALRREAEKRSDASVDKVLQELGRLAFSSVLDFSSVTDDGLLRIDFSAVDRAQAAAIAAFETDTLIARPEDLVAAGFRADAGPVVLRTRVRLNDKLAALNALARHLGLFAKDNAQRAGAVTHAVVPITDARKAARVARAIENALRRAAHQPAQRS